MKVKIWYSLVPHNDRSSRCKAETYLETGHSVTAFGASWTHARNEILTNLRSIDKLQKSLPQSEEIDL